MNPLLVIIGAMAALWLVALAALHLAHLDGDDE